MLYPNIICNFTGLRVEWAKSLARAKRWEEEVLLLREEMRRILTFLKYQAEWWTKQGATRTVQDEVLSSGLKAYAAKQADLRLRMASDFAAIWLSAIDDVGLSRPKTWPSEFLNAKVAQKFVRERRDRNKMRQRAVNNVRSDSESESSDKEDLDDFVGYNDFSVVF